MKTDNNSLFFVVVFFKLGRGQSSLEEGSKNVYMYLMFLLVSSSRASFTCNTL